MPQRPRTTSASVLDEVDGIVHGFGRRDPLSSGEAREENRQRMRRSIQTAGHLLFLKQVHGARVVRAPWDGTLEADAAWVDRPGFLLGIETADCLPILMIDPKRRAAAAAHAGWRGTVAEIAARVAEKLLSSGSRISDLIAAIGPGIGACCYEIGGEVAEAFGGIGSGLLAERDGRCYLDLRAANRRQLESVGVAPARIEDIDECTACRPLDYYSFRRDGAASGRMISYVGWPEVR